MKRNENKMKLEQAIIGTKNGLLLTDKKKITIITNTKKANGENKNYYSYQFNIPLNTMQIVYEKQLNKDGENKLIYLQENNKQRYKFIFANTKPENAIETSIGINQKKRYVSYTLPKKHIEYLQAYDKYLDVLKTINKDIQEKNKLADDKDKIDEFKQQPLYINLETVVTPNDNGKDLNYDMSFKIYTNVEQRFIDYAKKETAKYGGLPGWLQVLANDWETQKFLESLEIDDPINKWKY